MSLRIAGWDPSVTFDNRDLTRREPRSGMRWVAKTTRVSCGACLGLGVVRGGRHGIGTKACGACSGSGKEEEA